MNIKATIVEHTQGSQEWLAHRARSLNASDLAAAMGMSRYKTRDQLIAEKATGIVHEPDIETQRRFDLGHQYEAAARPLAEEETGEALYPCVLAAEVDGLPLSASLDGMDLMQEMTWEHKMASAALVASLESGVIPPEYHPQMEQGLMLSGASRCLFSASKGDRDTMRSVWYESNPELRAKIIPTWRQFMADVANYVPQPVEVKPIGRTPENLPALRVEVTGKVVSSNLAEYKEHALSVFKGINRTLETDQDFADAEKVVKWCEGVEDRLQATKEHALSQTASIEELFNAIDTIAAEAKRTRLELDKLVKARKEQIREEIVTEGRSAIAAHIASLNARLGKPYMPAIPADFAGAIKGKRTVESLRDAVNTTLAHAKIQANEIADRIQVNLNTLRELASDHAFLFADTPVIVLKAPEDLTMLVKSRVADHKQAEANRLEAERERIRAEEAARLEREQAEANRIHQAQQPQQVLKAEPAPVLADATDRGTAVIESPRGGAMGAGQAAAAAPAGEPATLKLGTIGERLGFTLTEAFVSEVLGIKPSGKDKRAVMFKESDFGRICAALVNHIQKAKAGELLAA